MPYQFAAGYNNTGGLATLSPQPAFAGVRVMEQRFPVSGGVVGTGMRYGSFFYTMLLPDEYDALLTVFGLDTAESAEGTFRILADADRTTFSNWNGIIGHPFNPQFAKGFYLDVEFRIRKLIAI